MCGIAGIILVGPPLSSGMLPVRPALDAADAAIAHRGPDGRGEFEDAFSLSSGLTARVHLLHRRLAIIDEAGGHQPMVRARAGSPSDRVAVVFNGCIYNHPTLRRDLVASGAAFESDHSDTEVLTLGWAAKGPAILRSLDGMFAAAVWDSRAGTLTLARDRAGEKPLYHAAFACGQGTTAFAFASTLPALLAIKRALAPAGRHEIDPARMRAWAAFGFGTHPPIVGVEMVAPGHRAVLDLAAASPSWSVEQWWSPPARGGCPDRLNDTASVLAAIDRSVGERLVADVPVGCFLSGGIDSPLIAASAQRHVADLRTFTVRMPDSTYDESARAAEIARHLGTRHATLECDATPCEDLERLIPQLGLPLGDSSLLPTAWVSRAARAHVKVALSGDGADELFDGYARYRAAGMLRSMGSLLALMPAVVGRGADPRSRRSRVARLAAAARGWGYEDLLAIFPSRAWTHLAGAQVPPGVGRRESLADPSRADALSYLPEDLLRKVDTASMAVALEVRAPFLASSILESRLAEPSPEHAGRKRVLREAARVILPPGFADAPKSGFAVPIGAWFRSNFAGLRTLLHARVLRPDAFDAFSGCVPFSAARIEAMMAEHERGSTDHSQRLYHLLVLSIWSDWLKTA